MALAKANLGFPTIVSAGTTSTIYSVSSAKTVYIRSIVIYNSTVGTASTDLSQQAQIYIVPNSGGSVGTATDGNRIARISLASNDTFFFEPQYPITLTSNGDSIQVFNEGTFNLGVATNDINVVVLGDREA
jgi:hypothetical protein